MTRIQADTITAWLGPAVDDMTEEQVDRFTELVRDYEHVQEARPLFGTDDYEEDDYADDDTAAWVAALEIATGAFSLEERGRALIQSRTDAYQGAVMATLAGESEVQAAQQAAISRPTLRKALGK